MAAAGRATVDAGGGLPATSTLRSDGRIPIMNMPAKADVDDTTREMLGGLAIGDPELLLAGLDVREDWQIKSGLDSRIIALGAPPASYLWQVPNALDAGATPADLLGVLYAVAPQVGGPKVVAAAPELMVALGLSLPEGQ